MLSKISCDTSSSDGILPPPLFVNDRYWDEDYAIVPSKVQTARRSGSSLGVI